MTELLTYNGYMAHFWSKVQEGMTHKEAYESTENELKKHHFPARYCDYESFRQVKYRKHREKRASKV